MLCCAMAAEQGRSRSATPEKTAFAFFMFGSRHQRLLQ
jgi:hypothetical protein